MSIPKSSTPTRCECLQYRGQLGAKESTPGDQRKTLGTATSPQATNPPKSGKWTVVKELGKNGLYKDTLSTVYKLQFFPSGHFRGLDENDPKVTIVGWYNVVTKELFWHEW